MTLSYPIATSTKFLRVHHFVPKISSRLSTLSETNVEEIKIPVPWGHISGKWWGDRNRVPAIAIHGWQDNAGSFDKLIPHLNLPAVLAIDLPGHGYSSHLPDGKLYEFYELLVLLHQIFTEQKWTKVPLLTHSFGGSLGFAYASLFPGNIKWLVNFDCARTLLSLYRYVTAQSFSKGVDSHLRIEEQKKLNASPTYKLSDMVRKTVEGSVGSVTTPQSALILLKRGATLTDNPPKSPKSDKSSMGSDMQDLIDYERAAVELMSSKEKRQMEKYYINIMDTMKQAKINMKDFTLPEEEDKYYVFTRDPSTKIKAFLSTSNDFIIEAAKNIKCPILSMRASHGFLFGSGRKIYEQSLEHMKNVSSHFEHHEIEGTHHAHLNNPENLAPIINQFVAKFSPAGS